MDDLQSQLEDLHVLFRKLKNCDGIYRKLHMLDSLSNKIQELKVSAKEHLTSIVLQDLFGAKIFSRNLSELKELMKENILVYKSSLGVDVYEMMEEDKFKQYSYYKANMSILFSLDTGERDSEQSIINYDRLLRLIEIKTCDDFYLIKKSDLANGKDIIKKRIDVLETELSKNMHYQMYLIQGDEKEITENSINRAQQELEVLHDLIK